MSLHKNQLSNPNFEINVLFLSKLPKEVESYISNNLKRFKRLNLIFPDNFTEEEILKISKEADIIVGWRPSMELLENAKRLKLFIVPGTGVNHIIDNFKKINQNRNVLLANGHGNSYFVAQHAVSLLLTFMSKIIPHHLWMKEGKWRTGDKEAASIPLRFKNIGLLGYGAINQKVHNFLAGFDIEFSVFRKDWSHKSKSLPTPVKKFSYPNIEDFLKESEILIIAIPVTKLTINMITKKELTSLGDKGIIVNVSRGEIINEKDLYFALKNKLILGACVDVWYEKNPIADKNNNKYPYHYPFHDLKNIIFSPHRGYSPFNDLLRWNELVENIARMVEGKKDYINIVDLEEGY
ncbi:MAG: NAD(P)-dependent oxidoreductase [Promethearchaeati archaeon]